MKKFTAMILALALCLGLVSFGSAEGDSYTVGILMVTSQSQWCNDMVAGVKEVVEADGGKVIVSDSQVSVDMEMSGMENLLNAGCNAIVVNCMNAAGLADTCKRAQEKGIFIIGWTENLGYYDALVVEDEETESNMVADAIAAYMTKKELTNPQMATIWLADSANPDTNAGQYKKAQDEVFQNRLVNELGVNIVSSQFATDTPAAMNAVEGILAANDQLKILFAQSDEMGVAIAQAIQGRGIAADDFFIVGLDGTDEAIRNVASGTSSLAATIFIDTVNLGKGIGESILTFLKTGEKKDVITEYTLIDASNAADYVK